ncbi:DUF5655 domain-containing protein [Parvibaculum sp.]|uniref:DUF5655 domain-containing protein n=1 Tax=Parvibaculum sp. TaxID=2024848 RepID=UPI001B073BE0|nr:DUF5655 domain-containing protein [Parvibaculum sp.]MBO6635378.1 hypothetical protein [Parvibaculum sp.]MBO6677381.1 hypothetical protein [Parvibaculum sp.]MBO6684552.1 hypothetical protein [Parvibaculum sp.]MBO6903978.1 hypothetical protein [Parvibaculum sp.]
MAIGDIEKFFCNECKRETKHFIRGEHLATEHDKDDPVSFTERLLIIECCGCENLALVKRTHFSEDVDYSIHPVTGEQIIEATWSEEIYPPVSYRAAPTWFEDLPDPTLRQISEEIYKSLQNESHYLATFGSRTLIDRLIVLTVGDQGSFVKGLKALQDSGKISPHEREILQPIIDAGNAAAHRGWAPSGELIETILDTVEGLIHRLLVLPKLAEELEEAVPGRASQGEPKIGRGDITVSKKIETAPKALKQIYDYLQEQLRNLGSDVTVHPQKHYVAFRRRRNFASVQLYNQKRLIRVYLNLDPDDVKIDESYMRDVRQIGHFGTGNLEVVIKKKEDIERVADLIKASYEAS